ncbi:hypothetical protein [Halothermothrix orenii]|uniref:VWFA domain-containing protein n=1 Tax=Halothermothrix orenii (strain H 168 / OCM 544 / DSM 9562) TaxID=373903 RepID=B8CX05_HALOH|nr:hypothetical protein [Halothermothrix orenii]ACL69824.1 hypothetical protein Hore_10690 [Halothermothrix orenii H 168]
MNKQLRVLLGILLIIGLFLGSYEGIWKQGAKKVSGPDIKKADNNEIYLEVIWDASGSMWGKEYGVEKIIRSREVLKTFTDKLSGEINMGLRIFGARRIGDLKDSFLAVPFNEKNKDKVLNFIANVKPLGKSPIGYSLLQAKGRSGRGLWKKICTAGK